MELFFKTGFAAITLYSVCLAWYLAQYRLALAGVAKGVTFMALGTVIFVVTLALTVFVIWPPILPL